MVRRACALVGAAALCALLATCSMFPASLTQVTAQRDLSEIVAGGTGSQYNLYALTTGDGVRFVILVCTDASIDPTIVVMDEGLTVLQTYTRTQLDSWAGGSFSGSAAAVGPDGNVGIGNLWFTSAQLKDASGASLISGTNLWSGGVTALTASPPVLLADWGYTSGSDYLNFYQFMNWTGSSYTYSYLLGSPATGYNITACLTKDDVASGQVVIALSVYSDDSKTISFLKIPLADLPPGGTASQPLINTYLIGQLSNLDSQSIGVLGGY
ncbi:MAG TPA: hypothetical protein VHE79_01020, partial [Spirochaetia bacterium]